MPKTFTDPEAIADDIIRDVGRKLVVGLPLGLGKANHIVNALYARAAADRSIDLTFFSALTLEKPKPANLLESRFITPVIDRLFGGYPDLAYADPLRHGRLPSEYPRHRVLLPRRPLAACSRGAAELHLARITPTPHPICSPPASTWWRNSWRSAWSMACRATASPATPTPRSTC